MAPHAFHQVIAGQQQLAAFAHQHLASGGEVGLPPPAHHQLGAQARFQFLDVHAHGGRRQVQRLRGGGKSTQVGDGDQSLQLVEVQVTHQDL